MQEKTLTTFFVFLTCLLSFTVEAKPGKVNDSASLQQPVENMTGTWQGFMYCTNINYLFDMKVDATAGQGITASFTAKLFFYQNGKKPRGGVYPSKLNLKLSGKFFPAQSGFVLQTQGGSRNDHLLLKGVLDPTTDRFAAEVTMPYFGQCSMALAGKKGMARILKKIDRVSRFTLKQPRPNARANVCDGAMKAWLDKVEPMTVFDFDYQDPQAKRRFKYTALELFQDEHFKPVFGKSFTDLSEKKAGAFYQKLVNGCSRGLSRQQSTQRVFNHAIQLVQNSKALPRSELLMYPYIKQILRHWKQAAIQQFPQLPPQASQQLTILADSILTPLWPAEKGSIREELRLANRRSAGEKMLRDLALELEQPMTFSRLARLAVFVDAYSVPASNAQGPRRQENARSKRRARFRNVPDIQQSGERLSPESKAEAAALITTAIDQNILSAAEQFVRTITTPAGVLEHLAPLGTGRYKALMQYLDADQAGRLDQLFSKRKADLLAEMVQSEKQKFAAIGGEGMVRLQSLNAFETRLAETYGALLNDSAFQAFNQTRRQHRVAALQKNRAGIARQFAAFNKLPQLEQAYGVLLLEHDRNTAAGDEIRSSYLDHRRRIAPLLDYPGGVYLDAIYQGDFSSLRAQDRQYGREASEQFDRISAGLAPGTRNPYSMKSLENRLTLIRPILATYLFSYQDISKACLRPDHAEFEVVKHVPDTVTTNLLGWEISRSYGYTTYDYYKVNKEFEQLFRIVGTSSPGGIGAWFFDYVLGSGQMGAAIRGTKSLMRDFDCNGAVIRQFEKNMRTYASQRLR